MKEKIVMNAWELTTEFPSLKKLNFLPSLFGMSWLFLILIYQVAFTYILVVGKSDEVMNFIYNLPSEPYFIPLIIGILIIFLLYMFLNPLSR